MDKESLKYQVVVWGNLKEKLERHREELQTTKGGLLKFIISEFYGKIKTDYNK